MTYFVLTYGQICQFSLQNKTLKTQEEKQALKFRFFWTIKCACQNKFVLYDKELVLALMFEENKLLATSSDKHRSQECYSTSWINDYYNLVVC